MIVYDDQMKMFQSTLFKDKRYYTGFGTRMSGDGRNRSTILNFFETFQVPYQTLIIPEQIHSANVETVTDNGEKIQVIGTTDGVVTHTDNVLLTVITGDCVPIIFCDTVKGIVGISHQGWRGSLKKLAGRVINEMIERGAHREDIKVAIGPSIGACCYEIYGDRLYEFLSEFEDIQDQIILTRGGKAHLNLLSLNYHQLVHYGILKKNIDYFPFCTKCDQERFFSFQRDKKESYGEMFSYIMKS